MNSSSGRRKQEQKCQEDIKKEIARLQSLLNIPVNPATEGKSTAGTVQTQRRSSRPEQAGTCLAPATPSPKKKRRLSDGAKGEQRASSSRTLAHGSKVAGATSSRQTEPLTRHKPGPSALLGKMATVNSKDEEGITSVLVHRSTSFSEAPQPPRMEPYDDTHGAPKRDERLALVEELEMGPYDHKAPFDDPDFLKLEPNSGIRLSSRNIPHEDFDGHLYGRYYIPPSRLYSSIRLLPDKHGYEVPVDGDWVTIAVVAERGPIKQTKAPAALAIDNGDDGSKDRKGKGKSQADGPRGKKYVNIKLVDFGSRSRSASSATAGKAVIRGDAFLTLLLFESDGFDTVTKDDGGRAQKVYRGGSKGAFEAMSKMKEGDVIALLNPKILRPFQSTGNKPHPTSNILALTPESASSIIIIGRSADLGMCVVEKRDGKPCGSWYDKRVSDMCEWHLQNAFEHRKASRPEFSVGTSGLPRANAKRKTEYDPARQWGLKPSDGSNAETGATYVVSGHVVGGASNRSLFMSEDMGREGQAKAARKMKAQDADRELQALLKQDRDGMKKVLKARQVGHAQGLTDGKKRKRKSEASAALQEEAEDETRPKTSMYSAQVIQNLGFDPAVKPGQRRTEDSSVQKKLEALASVRSSQKVPDLGPRPGPRIRSGVVAPQASSSKEKSQSGILLDLDESDDDLENGLAMYGAKQHSKTQTVNLDDLSD